MYQAIHLNLSVMCYRKLREEIERGECAERNGGMPGLAAMVEGAALFLDQPQGERFGLSVVCEEVPAFLSEIVENYRTVCVTTQIRRSPQKTRLAWLSSAYD